MVTESLPYFQTWSLLMFIKLIFRTPYKRIYDFTFPGIALPISRLIKTIVILMLIGHIDACLFWRIDRSLTAEVRWIDDHLTPSYTDTPTKFRTQYLVSYLSALRSLVLKLRDARNDTENTYVIFEFLAGILAYGTVFGNIHSIVEMLDNTAVLTHAEEQHKFKMEWLKSYMRQKKLKPELQQMVIAYKEIQWQRSKGMDESLLFSDVPKTIQQEIKNFLYLDLVKKVPAFSDTDANFQNLLTFKIKAIIVLSGWFIFRKGDEGEEMYFIKSGQVEIVGDNGIVFVTLSTGSFFGEIALFEACKRTASARAKGDVELCTLRKEDFEHIMNAYPVVAEKIRQTIRERKEQELKVKEQKALEEAQRKKEEEERKLKEEEEEGRSRLAAADAASRRMSGGSIFHNSQMRQTTVGNTSMMMLKGRRSSGAFAFSKSVTRSDSVSAATDVDNADNAGAVVPRVRSKGKGSAGPESSFLNVISVPSRNSAANPRSESVIATTPSMVMSDMGKVEKEEAGVPPFNLFEEKELRRDSTSYVP
ncbi:Cyclic nucleotide-gated olfactory channel [Chytridiales sp. JEL 0842]|nr:Cyclic nucleotide-gated olfactory channel [Chytridiales sp. JEL 0842]